MNTDEQKKLIRQNMRQLKKLVSPQQREQEAAEVFAAIEKLEAFGKATVVMAYWAMDDELPTRQFIEKWSPLKTIILPSVDGEKLKLKVYNGLGKLVAGDLFAIPEPNGPEFTAKEQIGFIVVPGIAFDKHNNRMGRGKAYYDQLLASLGCFKAGVGFSFQLIDKVPTEPHDMAMNIVVAGKVVTEYRATSSTASS